MEWSESGGALLRITCNFRGLSLSNAQPAQMNIGDGGECEADRTRGGGGEGAGGGGDKGGEAITGGSGGGEGDGGIGKQAVTNICGRRRPLKSTGHQGGRDATF